MTAQPHLSQYRFERGQHAVVGDAAARDTGNGWKTWC